ncbi:hypothetical protein AMJ87_02315 [candidate division WOR_3 bacterium SM23_60]|uniref:Uncharacterized protein n=1 Tax=candidate division WOR_3 bacterium SM23_60 TaxID=1703780 RepID=A0A0S8GKF5_UNCW3|nr:MAG: hypothetical protein AMJ87_02315 [candidate division WOR_3 bacterium SM23_60]
MFKKTFFFTFFVLISSSMFLQCSCDAQQAADKKKIEYADKIGIEISFASAEAIKRIDEYDVWFTVTNKGDKTVKRLGADIVFSTSSGQELGRTAWLFVHENETLERQASEEKKAKYRPLPPGVTITTPTDVIILFGGEPRLRDKVRAAWNDLSATVIVKEVVTVE